MVSALTRHGARPPRQTIELTDPRALRAYAHPVRLALIQLLRQRGPLTATQAAEYIGDSSGSCSFHLRQLAKYGLVEEAGGGRGRERPWRATAEFTSWNPAATDDSAVLDAERQLDAIVAERYLELIMRWLDRRDEDSPEWRQAGGYGDVTLPLTADELQALRRSMQEVLAPYLRRLTTEGKTPPGARLVTLLQFALPSSER